MFSIVKVARDQTKPGSLLARPRGRLDERPWERGCNWLCIFRKVSKNYFSQTIIHFTIFNAIISMFVAYLAQNIVAQEQP